MVLCGHCTRDCPETIDPKSGSVCCGVCGKLCADKLLIDDDVQGYLNTKQEYLYKKIIWEAMNKDYLQEQAYKQRYGTSKKRTDKRRQQQQQKRKPDANANATKPAAAAEAMAEGTRKKKRLSSKINYDVLDKLFDEETDPLVVGSGKKRARVESRDDSDGEDKNEVGNERNDDDKGLEMVDDKYEADTESCNGDEEEQENGDEEEEVDDEEEDMEERYARNEEECDYGYDDESW